MAKAFNFTFDSAKLLSDMADVYRRKRREVTGRRGKDRELVPCLFRRFELAEALPIHYDHEANGAKAWPLRWDQAEADYVADNDDEDKQFYVYDITGQLYGIPATDDRHGTRGWCIKPHDIPARGKAATNRRWEIVELARDRIVYAKALEDWTETNDAWPTVRCVQCDHVGNLINEDSYFIVYLPRLRYSDCLDPSVYQDDIIQWQQDEEGQKLCRSPYLWSRVGDFRWTDGSKAIPKGWAEADGQTVSTPSDPQVVVPDAAHRFLMARDPDSSYTPEKSAGNTGGYRLHGQTENNHPDHTYDDDPVDHNLDGATTTVLFTGVGFEPDFAHKGEFTSDDTDNRPPFLTAKLIYRYK